MDVITAEKQLNDAIRSVGGTLIHLSDDEFKGWAARLGKELQTLLLEKHRGSRNFYKKILSEERRAKFPNSHRYSDAEMKLRIYNAQGKALKTLIDS